MIKTVIPLISCKAIQYDGVNVDEVYQFISMFYNTHKMYSGVYVSNHKKVGDELIVEYHTCTDINVQLPKNAKIIKLFSWVIIGNEDDFYGITFLTDDEFKANFIDNGEFNFTVPENNMASSIYTKYACAVA